MACSSGAVQLSPTDKEVAESVNGEFLTIEQIAEKTDLPLFKVRSSIRLLKRNNLVVEENDAFKLNN